MVNDWGSIVSALIAAGAGGGMLKLLEMWLSKGKVKFDEGKSMRDEYRADIRELRLEIGLVKAELKLEKTLREEAERREDYWKDWAFKLVIKFRLLQNDMRNILKNKGIEVTAETFADIEFPVDR